MRTRLAGGPIFTLATLTPDGEVTSLNSRYSQE